MSVAEQYATDKNLKSRANLHAKYGTRNWFAFVHEALAFKNAERVGDIGCGPGWFWRDASARGANLESLLLVDTSAFLLQQAQENLSKLSDLGALSALEADVVALPVESGSFDTVLALHMLYHAKDQKAAIAELKRICATGGRVAISTNGLENMARMNRLGHEAFGEQSQDLGAVLFSPQRAEELLGQVFDCVDIHRFEDRYEISEPADIFAALLSFPPGDTADQAKRTILAQKLDELEIDANNPFCDTRVSYLLVGS